MENMCTNKITDGKRRKRTSIKGSAKSTLEKHFGMEQRPSLETIAKLAESLRIKKNIVRIWFCNRRYREKYMKPLTSSNTSVSPIPAEIEHSSDSANLSPVQSTDGWPPSEHSLQPSVQDSIVSSDTYNKRTVLEESPKDTLEKHFAKEPKPSLATMASLADSLRMKAEVVRTWFANRRYKEKRMKKFTTLMTPLRQTRLSASRILRSDEIADETAETIQTVNGNNSADLSGIDVNPLKRHSFDSVESEISLVEDQTPVQATAETNSISDEANNELPEIEYSAESQEMDSTVPSDARFASWPRSSKKNSKKRTVIEGSLKDALEKHFHEEPKPSLKAIASLAHSLHLKAKVVRVWFANRRHKEKYSKPIAKSNRSGRTNRAASQTPILCQIADETADTAMRDLVESFTENNSSTVEQITDSDNDDESIPGMPHIISSPSNSTELSETAVINHRTSGGSFKNGRPWGPLSRRQPVIEDQTEQEQVEIPETPREPMRKLRFAERLIKRCKNIGNQNDMDVYAVPLIKSAESDSNFERFSFGNADEVTEHRTVLVLGSDGSNRATFINGIINFIFDVEQDDHFRFQLIDEGESNGVKVYDIHHIFGFRVTYSITIVAVPSYDTITNDSQYFRDQNVAKMLLALMENDGGIQQLDMICNVVTEAVFNQSFMSIFGKDMAGSISNWQPFNHLGDTCSWLEVIQRFCTALADKNPKSLSLTKQVLEERKQMEAVMDGMESLIKISHGKTKEMDKAKQMIVFCDSQIQSTDEEEDECFMVEMKKKVELPAGEWVYNCNRCYVTCHDSFFKEENVNDGHLNSDDLYESTVTGYCSVCPDQCNLIMHSNQPYRWVSVEKETKISPDSSKIERNEAEIKWKDIKSKGRDLIKVLEKDLAGNGKVILEHFVATWRCIQRLNRIALRGNSFLTRKVFDVLYDAEQQLKELGFQDGLASLRN